jgi:hypothetical protein
VLGILGKAEPRIDQQARAGDPGRFAAGQGLGELGLHFEHHVVVGGGAVHVAPLAAEVHDDRGDLAIGHESGHLGIEAKAAHVVQEVGARVQRRPSDLGLRGIDGERSRAASPQIADHGSDPLQLLFSFDARGPRTCGFATHVHDVGPGLEERKPAADRRIRVSMLAAVGERIGGNVQDPHDQRSVPEDTLRASKGEAIALSGSGDSHPDVPSCRYRLAKAPGSIRPH